MTKFSSWIQDGSRSRCHPVSERINYAAAISKLPCYGTDKTVTGADGTHRSNFGSAGEVGRLTSDQERSSFSQRECNDLGTSGLNEPATCTELGIFISERSINELLQFSKIGLDEIHSFFEHCG